MKTKLSYKITGAVVAIMAATALSASAQDATAPANPTVPPVTAPTTAPDAVPATPPIDQATPAETTATAPAAAPAVAADSGAAKDFIREAYMANEFSIAAAQLAATQAESAEVKATAKTVLDNGLKTRDGMVAAIQGATTDMHFDQNYTADYQTKLGELKAAKGADFDAKYVASQGEVNDKAESVFKAYAASGTDETVKTFAANTLPVLNANGDALDAVAQGGN
jgi:putative membrane protein